MVNKPFIRPAISGGGTWPGGGLVDDRHDLREKQMQGPDAPIGRDQHFIQYSTLIHSCPLIIPYWKPLLPLRPHSRLISRLEGWSIDEQRVATR